LEPVGELRLPLEQGSEINLKDTERQKLGKDVVGM
jgi:hypothetical protein